MMKILDYRLQQLDEIEKQLNPVEIEIVMN